jgi:hypothetical protein
MVPSLVDIVSPLSCCVCAPLSGITGVLYLTAPTT